MERILKLSVIAIYLVLAFLVGYISGVESITVVEPVYQQVSYPNGYEVFEELNRYRAENGLEDLVLYQPLCNNIAERWMNYRENESHEGLDEFARVYVPSVMVVSEVLVTGRTAEEMVDKWSGSPSHDLYIRNNSKACVYSAGGYSVALLSN